jgi:hypothetical protein
MEQWTSWLQAAAGGLGPYGPRLLGGLAILIGAWLAARLARTALLRLASARQLDERLQSPGLAATMAGIVQALVWLVALPALLGTLGLDGLLAPVNAMMARLLGVLPNLLGAAAVFGVGLLAARIARQLVTGLLKAAGSERLAARIGLGHALGDSSLAGLGGSVVFALVLLPTVAAALQTLGLEVIARPVAHLLEQVIDLVPRLISAALIVAIGAVLGRLLAGLVTALLAGVGVNRLPAQLGMPPDVRVGGRDLAELAGGVVMVATLLLAVTQACEVLGFGVLTEAVASLGGVLARLLVALVVLGVGLWLGAVAARLVAASALSHAAALARAARAAILFFTAALALRQTGLPGDIISIAFGAVVCGAALAVALAAGLGGRRVFERWLENTVGPPAGRRAQRHENDAG